MPTEVGNDESSPGSDTPEIAESWQESVESEEPIGSVRQDELYIQEYISYVLQLALHRSESGADIKEDLLGSFPGTIMFDTLTVLEICRNQTLGSALLHKFAAHNLP